jgi:hypothetical protein
MSTFKVYAVWWMDYEDQSIEAVYSSREEAEKHLAALAGCHDRNHYSLIEHDVLDHFEGPSQPPSGHSDAGADEQRSGE